MWASYAARLSLLCCSLPATRECECACARVRCRAGGAPCVAAVRARPNPPSPRSPPPLPLLPPPAVITTALTFTPLVAAAGGAVLGLAAAAKWVLTGRVLGVSGAVRGLVVGGDRSAWRLAFLAGLLGGGAVAGAINPGAFDVLPATFTAARAALGGLLVGWGASAGNGCTSGHGICGLSRLSRRSLAYVLTFMAAGAAGATLTGTPAALGVAPAPAPLVLAPSDLVLHEGGLLLATAVLTCAALAAFARNGRGAGAGSADADAAAAAAAAAARKRVAGVATDLAAGLLFAWGLAFAGMVRPTKVAGFLAPLAPSWDPSLAFVMAGAIAVALPAFQWVRCGARAGAPSAPLCGGAFGEPGGSVDARLLGGGVLFGLGWGISGMCPGPALVALAGAPSAPIAAYCVAMAAGMALDGALSRVLAPPKAAAA